MKFFAVAIAALVGFTDAKSLSNRDLNARIAKGQINKKTLMKGAKPYGNTGRKLDDAEWEITGEYSIKFDQCLSLQVENDNLIDEAYINYAEAGTIIAEKSYILFKACKTADCYYDGDDASLTFIVDAGTFVQALAAYIPNQRETYCQSCEENEDYCLGNYEAADEEEAAEDEDQGDEDQGDEDQGDEDQGDEDQGDEDRRKAMRVLANQKEYIDCDMCVTYGCFQDEDDGDQDADEEQEEQDGYDDALEWLEGVAECSYAEGYTWDSGGYVYGGLICNADGTGVQIGVFVDEDCELYLPSKPYSSIMTYAQTQYYSKSIELVEYMFKNEFDCNGNQVEYTNPYDEANEDQDENNDENQDENYETLEVCENLWDGDFEALSLYDCGADENNDEQQDEEEEQEEAAAASYSWYTYEISQNDLEDSSTVCNIVKSLESSHSNYYDEKNGEDYKFDYTITNKSKFSNGAGGLSGGAIAFLVIFCVGAAAGAAYVFKGQLKNSMSNDNKKAPLINGSMA
jgi:hypothetical protein